MKTTKLKCAQCGESFERYDKEVNRHLRNGRDKFFCSLSCGAIYSNASRKLPIVTIVCEYCGEDFKTTRKKSRFCSRSCASAGSVTDYRRAKQRESGLKNKDFLRQHIGDSLRAREGWKYVDVDDFLDKHCVKHIFEWQIGTSVFDLKLDNHKILVEFDGPYHRSDKQKALDNEKDKVAEAFSYRVIRTETESASVIPAEIIEKILLDEQII